MAALRGDLAWGLDLTNEEFLLVLKALGGRLREHEIAEALQLGTKLSEMRVGRLKAVAQTADQVEKALKGE